MDMILHVLQNYGTELAGGAAALAGIILLIMIARILSHVKKLNRSLSGITRNMEAYFNVILEEEAEEGGEKEEAEEEKKYAEERAAERKRDEDEKLVNAVLQEYFS